MSKRVTPKMVFLYVYGQLSEADRRLVEAVFPTDLQVQTWFVRLRALPDNVVEEEEEAMTLTPADLCRRDIEAACQSDAEVQRWFAELTPTEEELAQRPVPHVQLDSPAYRDLAVVTYQSVERDERAEPAFQGSERGAIGEPLGPDGMEHGAVDADEYFAQHADVRRVIAEIARGLIASEDGRKLVIPQPILKRWNGQRFGGTTVRAAAEFAGHFADGSRPEYPELPEPPYVVAFQHRVYIAQPAENVPYGVVRVIGSIDGRPLASIVRAMEFDETAKLWTLVVSATELFGRDVPNEDLDFYVQPARRELFEWFPVAEIEKLAARIPESRVREHQGIQALLHDLKEGKHDR